MHRHTILPPETIQSIVDFVYPFFELEEDDLVMDLNWSRFWKDDYDDDVDYNPDYDYPVMRSSIVARPIH